MGVLFDAILGKMRNSSTSEEATSAAATAVAAKEAAVAAKEDAEEIVGSCVKTSEVGEPNGVAALDANAKIQQESLPTLLLTSAPTTSTAGVLLQRALDTPTQKTYTCTAVTNTGTAEEPVYSYTWVSDVNVKGGTFTGNVTLNGGNNCLRIGSASGSGSYSFAIGMSGTKATGWYSTALGQNTSAGGQDSIAVGYGASTTTNAQAAFGKWTATSNKLAFVVGNGTANNARLNIGELSWEGDFYIAGGYQQCVVTIPAATTAYTFAEGSFRHSPSAAPIYTLPDVTVNTRTHEIVVEVTFTGYVRSSDDDSGSAYAWKAGTSLLYTDTATPTAGTTVAYTDTALTASAGTIAAYDSAASAISLVASCEFEDANGDAVVPRSTPEIGPGSVIDYLCRWSAGLGKWVILPVPLGATTEAAAE